MSNNCIGCNCTVMEKPLHRTKPKGQPDAGWMCMDCISKQEPELANNIREESSEVEDVLTDIFYPNLKK